MTMFGPDGVNELFWTTLDVSNAPQNLPGMTFIQRGTMGAQKIRPDTASLPDAQKVAWNPGHARIVVEFGTCRVRCDGVDPDAGMGQLYGVGTPNGPIIEYMSGLGDFQNVLSKFRVVREVAGTACHLSITYYN